jgi:transposase InsO family protein
LPELRVVRVLERLRQQGRKPTAIVIDNSCEFTSQVADQAYENQVELHFITPERPMENGFIESFNALGCAPAWRRFPRGCNIVADCSIALRRERQQKLCALIGPLF